MTKDQITIHNLEVEIDDKNNRIKELEGENKELTQSVKDLQHDLRRQIKVKEMYRDNNSK